MSDKAVLSAIEKKTKCEVRFFDLIEMNYLERTKKVYIVVAKHSLFFLKRNFSRVITGGQLFYAHITKFIEDENICNEVTLELSNKRPAVWENSKILIKSMNKALIMNYIEVAWVTDYIYRYGKFTVFPLHKLLKSKGPKESDYPLVQPFIDTQEIHYDIYSFFLHEDFEDTASTNSSFETGNFLNSLGVEASIHVHEPINIMLLNHIGLENIRATGMAYKKAITEHQNHYSVVRSQPYNKKMNLKDDISSWTGWELSIKTVTHNVVCIILRKTYIPPIMDESQDIAIIFRLSYKDQLDNQIKENDFIRAAYFAADTLSAIEKNNIWYKDVVQAKLDALLFDDESYKWIEMHLKMRPNCFDYAKAFLKSILCILKKDGVLVNRDLIDKIDDKIFVVDDPMKIAYEIINHVEGIDKSSDHPQERTKRNDWIMRVAKYLFFIIDYGILGNQFSISDVCYSIGLLSSEVDHKIRAILEFLFHLRSRDMIEEWKISENFVKDLQECKNFEKQYIFNETVFSRFLNNGYIAKLFHKGEETIYMGMLGLLLKSCTSVNLKCSICKQILKATANIQTNKSHLQPKDFYHSIIPSLVYVAKGINSSGSSVSVALFAVAALVNLSSENICIKSMLVNLDVASLCANLLLSKEDDLIKQAMILSINLTKEANHRQRFLSAGILPILVDILTTDYNNPHEKKQNILSYLCAVLGQLLNDSQSRQLCCEKYPVLDAVLYMYHLADPGSNYKSKIIFCLRQLCLHNWQILQRVGKHCILTAIKELRETKNNDFISNTLLLFQALSLYKPNCFDMKAAEIEESLEYVLNSSKVDTFYIKIVELQSQIKNQTKYDYFKA